jgi:hypothetical protein
MDDSAGQNSLKLAAPMEEEAEEDEGQCTCNVTLRYIRETLLWKSNKYYLLVCVCVCMWVPMCMGVWHAHKC